MKNIDYSLYLCTDRDLMSCDTLEECVERALKGGVTVVQLREKTATSRDFYITGLKIREITRRYGVPLIINDRADIALAVGADGVHLGQSDLSCEVVKNIAPSLIVGVTAHNRFEALEAQRQGADYIGVGAMCATSTKKDAKVISDGELEAIRNTVKIPMVLIGGINADNITRFKGKGDGVAVVSAIVAQKDITAAARDLKKLWN